MNLYDVWSLQKHFERYSKENMGDDVVFFLNFIIIQSSVVNVGTDRYRETRLICISSFFSFDIIKTYCWYYSILKMIEKILNSSRRRWCSKTSREGGWRPFVAVHLFCFFVLLNVVVWCEKSQRDEIKPEGQMRSSSRHTRVIVNNFSETLI